MATIRTAVPGDVPALEKLLRQFYSEAAGIQKLIGYDKESTTASLEALIKSPDAVVLVGVVEDEVVGLIAAQFSSFFFNHRVAAAHERFWFVVPEHRKGLGQQLKAALEAYAQSIGAEVGIMSQLDDSPAMDRLYRRSGYLPVERSYAKRL